MSAAAWLEGYLRQEGESDRAEVLRAGSAMDLPVRSIERAAIRLGVVRVRRGFPAVARWRLPICGPDGISPVHTVTPGQGQGLGTTAQLSGTTGVDQLVSEVTQDQRRRPKKPTTWPDDFDYCDRCDTPGTKIDGAGNRFCRGCAPHLWSTP